MQQSYPRDRLSPRDGSHKKSEERRASRLDEVDLERAVASLRCSQARLKVVQSLF